MRTIWSHKSCLRYSDLFWTPCLLTTYRSRDKTLHRADPPHPHFSDHYAAAHLNRLVQVETPHKRRQADLRSAIKRASLPKQNPHLCLIMHVGRAVALPVRYCTLHPAAFLSSQADYGSLAVQAL